MTYHSGLSMKEAKELQDHYGRNEISTKHRAKIIKKILHIFSEPIYLLLSCSSIIYYILGEPVDGLIMIAFVIFVIGIDVFQDVRTGNALRKLKEISTPKIQVIREGREVLLSGTELVPGDLMLISEGVKIPADGYLISAAGLCVDESILTGESLGVWKCARQEMESYQNIGKTLDGQITDNKDAQHYNRKDYCYTGTLVILGTGTLIIEKIGNQTEYGKIADKITNVPMTNSILQRQMKKLAKQCTYFAAILFLMVSFFTFFNLSEYVLSERVIHSMLAGVVLALSMIPGEFPVILSVFLSMGAMRLAKKKALIRHLPAVETLGAISVLCMDKTGTITQNKMQVTDYYIADRQEGKFCKVMALTCKTGTYDPVEKAMLQYGEQLCRECKNKSEVLSACNMHHRSPMLIKEYSFTNELKAMGQVWKDDANYLVAAKGSPETILSLCYLPVDRENELKKKIMGFLERGLRVICIADRTLTEDESIPNSLSECRLFFRGMIGLSDPARDGIKDNIKACYDAGIRVLMITGDHPVTASSIAGTVGIENSSQVITGDQISKMTDRDLRRTVMTCNLYARVLPLHKMRIVKALKDNGETVAMTGDGVNDSPAQKMADIGIAMGKHGSEVCREAADLILLDDNFTVVLDTIKDGRRIYQNIIKTIGYVFAIHLPIALISLVAPMFGIGPEALMLLPLHIVLLELVMDPTCSIALERQPSEDDIMKKSPRSPKEQLLTRRRLIKSMIQGLMIFFASFGLYLGLLTLSYPITLARTVGFAVLVLANIFLVLVNCSETESVLRTIKKIGKDRGIWLVNLITLSGICCMIYSPLNIALGFTPLTVFYCIVVLFASSISVFWYEII
ncbi:MAG: ATPase, P-type (transporting), superfamily, subfamily [Herbinix sp.]|nr:ATPase, P-type (transporting), superfamily, subfamily [Herbinix sp.]